jgi:hypothetical protein
MDFELAGEFMDHHSVFLQVHSACWVFRALEYLNRTGPHYVISSRTKSRNNQGCDYWSKWIVEGICFIKAADQSCDISQDQKPFNHMYSEVAYIYLLYCTHGAL